MKQYGILLLSVTAFWMACVSPAEMQQSWSNPEPKKDSTKLFQKILLVALLKDNYTRKVAEDKLAEQVRPRGVVSYNYLSGYESTTDTSLMSDKLKQDGFDGIIIMRLIRTDKNTGNNPGNYPTYYNSWLGYYSTTYPLYSAPGNYSANEIYNIETNIYSLNENKLLWSGITTTVNLSDKNQMIDRVIAAIKQKMKREGFIK